MSIISLSEALSSFKFSTSRNDRITLSSLEAASDTGAGELPAEMLERVFLLLGPQDLNAVVLVCRCQTQHCHHHYHHHHHHHPYHVQEVAGRGGGASPVDQHLRQVSQKTYYL